MTEKEVNEFLKEQGILTMDAIKEFMGMVKEQEDVSDPNVLVMMAARIATLLIHTAMLGAGADGSIVTMPAMMDTTNENLRGMFAQLVINAKRLSDSVADISDMLSVADFPEGMLPS